MCTALPWAAHPTPICLRHGYHLYRAPDGGWLIVTPTEQFIRLRVPSEQIEALLPVLDEQQAPQHALAAASAAPLRALLERFGTQGLLEHPSDHYLTLRPGQVVVQGANPLAAQVASLFAAADVAVDVQDSSIPEAPPTALVTCAEWLPDTAWQALGAWCQHHGVAWHTAYAEGTRFYLGPIYIPGKTASYIDLRARRLAAAAFPSELLAYWRDLETSQRTPPVRWPNVGALAMLAGALVADVLAYLGGSIMPTVGHQHAFDPADASWQRHPVLPIPRDLMDNHTL